MGELPNSTMPQFPFYHEVGEDERKTDERMSKTEHKQRDEDYEDIRYMINYRRNMGWDAMAKRGMIIYNITQTMKPDDEISRIFLGYSRMIIDKGIEQMTEGEPDFSFEPFGPTDHLKTIIWKHLIRFLLSKCEYRLHQDVFFRDYFAIGNGVFDTYIDYPQRTLRVPNENMEGGFEPVVVQDFRRPKVGVRALNPMNCWRNPNIDQPNQVPSCLRRRVITWNQFAQEFGRCFGDDRRPKYKNLEKIAKGTHVAIYYYQDEIRDIYRIYAKSFGSESDGFAHYPPEDHFGIQIFDRSLKIHERGQDGIVLRSTGLNLPGICSMRWGTFYDMYDNNYRGDHSVYGMGLPQRIEGEDTVMQTIFNMNIDNYRWSNTTALNYQGANADSYLDVDANRLYGGELIDGQITPMPLGISRISDFQAMQESIDRTTIPSTSINHQQMVGDTSKTAFEFAQRIRMANRGAEQRLARLESEVFKPVGSLLLANALTTLTVNDFEDMTEQDAKSARQEISEGRKTIADFKDLAEDNPQKRVIQYIPLKGEKIREEFSVTKKRKLDFNAPFTSEGKSTNTLIPDKSMNVETSYIPLVEEYVYPANYIESGMLPDVIVDSKRMLGDMKAQDTQQFNAVADRLLALIQAGWKGIDLDKYAEEIVKFGDISPDRLLIAQDDASEPLMKAEQAIEQMEQFNNPQLQQEGVAPPTEQPQEEGSPLEQIANSIS